MKYSITIFNGRDFSTDTLDADATLTISAVAEKAIRDLGISAGSHVFMTMPYFDHANEEPHLLVNTFDVEDTAFGLAARNITASNQ